jgi:DNA topoisomerase-1
VLQSVTLEHLEDPQKAALHGGLHYSGDASEGIRRLRRGKGFRYELKERVIRDDNVLARIRALAIPPAWTEVWISPDDRGHIVATGRDARGRKQYRYHPDFVAVRDAAKFDHLVTFAMALPRLRRRVARDMACPEMSREKVLATLVWLLERTLSRIGNEKYAAQNRSYGLTTLRNAHAETSAGNLRLRFKGKSGKTWSIHVEDRRVAKIVRACQELPGQRLFEYVDADGTVRKIESGDVNAYVKETTGVLVTAKDFRTWTGTLLAAKALSQGDAEGAPTEKQVKEAVRTASERLGNTLAICRKCYIHPRVIAAYKEGKFSLPEPSESARLRGLSADENRLLAFLRKRETKRR